jgi:hypothetical protein
MALGTEQFSCRSGANGKLTKSQKLKPFSLFISDGFFRKKLNFAQKKGEVAEPAGGETGGPRSLAEVCILLKAV